MEVLCILICLSMHIYVSLCLSMPTYVYLAYLCLSTSF